MKCTLTKKSHSMKAAAPGKMGAVPNDFNLQDNGDVTATIFGVDATGQGQIDLSTIATLAVTSDAPSTVSVSLTSGMSFTENAPTNPAPTVGTTANITAVVTFNDGTTPPLTLTWRDTVVQGPAAALTISRGPVSVH